MDAHAAKGSATRVGLITLPIGLVLVADPARVGRLLGGGSYQGALRTIGVLDLALVPGLLAGRRRSRWLMARAGLNLLIGGYCVRLVATDGGRGAKVAAAAMVAATIADAPAIVALREAAPSAAHDSSSIL